MKTRIDISRYIIEQILKEALKEEEFKVSGVGMLRQGVKNEG